MSLQECFEVFKVSIIIGLLMRMTLKYQNLKIN